MLNLCYISFQNSIPSLRALEEWINLEMLGRNLTHACLINLHSHRIWQLDYLPLLHKKQIGLLSIPFKGRFVLVDIIFRIILHTQILALGIIFRFQSFFHTAFKLEESKHPSVVLSSWLIAKWYAYFTENKPLAFSDHIMLSFVPPLPNGILRISSASNSRKQSFISSSFQLPFSLIRLQTLSSFSSSGVDTKNLLPFL